MMEYNEIDTPIEYLTLDEEGKNILLDKIIDSTLKMLENALMFNQDINRIEFLKSSLNESLRVQEHFENYECCALIKDLIDRIDAT